MKLISLVNLEFLLTSLYLVLDLLQIKICLSWTVCLYLFPHFIVACPKFGQFDGTENTSCELVKDGILIHIPTKKKHSQGCFKSKNQ